MNQFVQQWQSALKTVAPLADSHRGGLCSAHDS